MHSCGTKNIFELTFSYSFLWCLIHNKMPVICNVTFWTDCWRLLFVHGGYRWFKFRVVCLRYLYACFAPVIAWLLFFCFLFTEVLAILNVRYYGIVNVQLLCRLFPDCTGYELLSDSAWQQTLYYIVKMVISPLSPICASKTYMWFHGDFSFSFLS